MKLIDILKEERRYTDNDITDKDGKKAKLIYGILKTGKVNSTSTDITYRYELPDDYWLSIDDETGEIIVILTMNPLQTMKLYSKLDSSTTESPVGEEYDSIHRYVKEKIKNKFRSFNMDIIF